MAKRYEADLDVHTPSTPFAPVFFLFVIGVILVGTYYIANVQRFTRHARTAHASSIPAIEKCFNGAGTLSSWYQMPDGRWARYCRIGNEEHVFWRIFDCDGPIRTVITQFKQVIRSKDPLPTRLLNYISNKRMDVVPPMECE